MNKTKSLFPLILTGFLIWTLSCATAEESVRPQWRMTGFALSDGSNNLIQELSIRYDVTGRPTEIITSGPKGNEISHKTITYTERGAIGTLKEKKKDSTIITTYSYDKNGFLTGVVKTDENGDPVVTATYNNDERGNPLDWSTKYNQGGDPPVHFLGEYDDANRVTQTTELDPEGNTIYYSRSEYNDLGKESSYTIYTPEGKIDQQLRSTYTNGFLSKTEVVDDTGKVLFSTVYKLNDSGQPVDISHYNQYGDKSDYTEISYDDKGLEIERASYNYAGDMKEKITKEYDDAGNNTLVTIYNASGKASSITRNTWENKPLAMKEKDFQSLVFAHK